MAYRSSIFGIIYIILSLFILFSLVFYDENISTLFITSTNSPSNLNLFSKASAFCANVVIQIFGLFSYLLSITMLGRGISFFYWKRSKFKYQLLWIIIFITFCPMLYNIISTYPLFQNLLSSYKFNCYAGGCIGYTFSKLIFIDALHQNQVYTWQIITILIIIIWSLQYICCFYYIEVFNKTNTYFRQAGIYKTIIKKYLNKTEKLNKLINQILLKIKKLWSKTLQLFPNKKQSVTSLSNRFKQYHQNQPIVIKQATNNMTGEIDEQDSINQIKVTDTDQSNFDSLQHNDVQDTSNELQQCSQKQTKSKYNNEFDYDKNVKYTLPTIDLLNKFDKKQNCDTPEALNEMSHELIQALEEFNIKGEILKVRPGPIITVFEFKPAPGIKTSRIISLSEDIARSMSAVSARISAIPGRNVIGIELPNKKRQTVYLSELFSGCDIKNQDMGIPLALGKDTNGIPVMVDLAKMPHLLIAGTTGSGKSVAINGMILSILFRFKPDECKLIMIDPKMLELSAYNNIPHLLTPVVTDPKKAITVLEWAVSEMGKRYISMAKLGVRNIDGFNEKLKNSKDNPNLLIRKIQTGFDPDTRQPIFETQKLNFEPMPYIVIIVDEMADLMLVAGKEVETAIQRLAQMARAAGIHLIMATQRPSVDVITGTIKANFPTRISFQVTSKIDSRTILGEQGAEYLLGQGDMLYMSGVGRIKRLHGPFVQDTEIDRVVDFIKSQELPHYVEICMPPDDNPSQQQKKHQSTLF